MSNGTGRKVEIFRVVMVSVWEGELRGASDAAIVVYMRLRTGPESSVIPGVVVIGRAALAEAMGWELPKVLRALKELAARGCLDADWDRRLVWMPRAALDGNPDNPNQVVRWARYWSVIPDCDLKHRIHGDLRAMLEPREPEFLASFDRACPKPPPRVSRTLPKGSRNVPPKAGETGRGSHQDQGSGEGTGKGEGTGGPRAPIPLRPGSQQIGEPDLNACLQAFRDARDEAITGGQTGIVASETPRDVEEFREALRQLQPQPVQVREAARRFFARKGTGGRDAFWQQKTWRLHVFTGQGLEPLLEETIADQRMVEKAAALKEALEFSQHYPRSAKLYSEDLRAWKDLATLVLVTERSPSRERQHQAVEDELKRREAMRSAEGAA
jgi:hypothetical protein